VSLVWTLAVGGGSLAIGITSSSLALAAFGATGLLDAVGSASLVLQFAHARSRGSHSHRFEAVTLRIVTIGLAATAIATSALAVGRLRSHGSGESSRVGVAISAASIVVLVVLAAGKRRFAARIPSHALFADSWVSAVGAALAVIAAVGVILRGSLGWWWADPTAALVVGVVAVCLSAWLLRSKPD
jgi:divalent metal cation (Fe/Co/Zn/Cd) transporter